MTLTTGLTTGLPTLIPADDAIELARSSFAAPRASRRWTAWLVVTLDLLAGASACAATMAVAATWGLPTIALLALGWPLAVWVAGGYSLLGTDPYAVRPRALLGAGAVLAVAAWAALALGASGSTSSDPGSLAASTLVLATAASALTIGLRCAVPLAVPRRAATVVLVGGAADVRELLRESMSGTRRSGYEPVAVCLPERALEEPLDAEAEPWPVPVWYGPSDHLLDVVRASAAEGVVVVPGPDIRHAELRRWGSWLQDRRVELLVSPGLRDVAPSRLGRATLGGHRLLRIRHASLTGPGQRIKWLVDRVAAALLLLLLAPLLALLALWIRLDSSGPAIFRQTRVGQQGRPFTVYKLRTMRADAERVLDDLSEVNESDRDGVLFKIKRDPRITRLGAMLRRYSLDELPQLLNVVRGEMSLIGPRPSLPCEVQAYDDDLRRRLAVKPGLTGLWQVSGRSDLSWEETVRLDLQYVDNWSWALDTGIAIRTATAVLTHRGAY